MIEEGASVIPLPIHQTMEAEYKDIKEIIMLTVDEVDKLFGHYKDQEIIDKVMRTNG
jgi:inorganic pyrophosphatase